MDTKQVLLVGDQVRRLEALDKMHSDLKQHADTQVPATVHLIPLEHGERIRADRLLRVVAEEINDIVDELTLLGIEGLTRKVV